MRWFPQIFRPALAIALVGMLLLAGWPVGARAAGAPVQFSVTPAAGQALSDQSVRVTLHAATGEGAAWGALQLRLAYDPALLEYTGYEPAALCEQAGAVYEVTADAAAGAVTLGWVNTTDFNGSSDILSLSFTVNGRAPATAELALTVTGLYDQTGQEVANSAAAGVIRIVSGGSGGGGSSGGGGGSSPSAPAPEATEETPGSAAGLDAFTDVSPDDWYYDSLQYVYEKGYFNGVSPTEMQPDSTMTRAMFVTVLARVAGADLSAYTDSAFSDVAADSWYASSVAWAYQLGLGQGTGPDQFSPDAPITREQIAVLLARFYLGRGSDPAIAPDSAPRYTDEAQVSAWAREALDFCTALQLLNGYPDGSFRPQNELTRAEAATIIMRLDQLFNAANAAAASGQ